MDQTGESSHRSHGHNNDRHGSDRRSGSDNHRSSNNNYSGSNNRNFGYGHDQRNRGHQSNRSTNSGFIISNDIMVLLILRGTNGHGILMHKRGYMAMPLLPISMLGKPFCKEELTDELSA
nr:hypothetical protein [Tanacetum cinerariifolium]